MRKLLQMVVPVIPLISGCAGSVVVFGHTVREGGPTLAAPATPAAPAAPAAPATPAALSQVPPTPLAAPAVAATPAVSVKLKAVALAFTSEAKTEIDADPQFKRDALLAAIHDQLRAHSLIDDDPNTTTERTIEVTIDDFYNRPSSNAVLFGYVLSNGRLTGNAQVRDAAGRVVQSFKVKADARLSASVDNPKPQPLASLYRTFADVTVSGLTGAPSKADSSNTDIPR